MNSALAATLFVWLSVFAKISLLATLALALYLIGTLIAYSFSISVFFMGKIDASKTCNLFVQKDRGIK